MLDEPITGSIGDLITSALQAADRGTTYLRVVMRHLVQANTYNLNVDEGFSHVFRAFDALIQHHDLGRKLSPMRSLKRPHKERITKTVADAAKELRAFAEEVAAAGEADQATVIRQVAGRLQVAYDIPAGYGKSLVALLEMFQLPDAAIIKQFYQEHPRAEKKSWPDVLSKYRGMVMHQAYLDFASGSVGWDEALTIFNHCLDVLTRIVLTILGFRGDYQPAVVNFQHGRGIRWVTPETPPGRLGYRAPGMPTEEAVFYTVSIIGGDQAEDTGPDEGE